MTRHPSTAQNVVGIVGLLIIAALSFVFDGPWWLLGLIVAVPYGLALWLAGRHRRSARPTADL